MKIINFVDKYLLTCGADKLSKNKEKEESMKIENNYNDKCVTISCMTITEFLIYY